MTVRELLNRIDSRELSEWKAYYTLKEEDFEAEKQKAEVNSKLKQRRR